MTKLRKIIRDIVRQQVELQSKMYAAQQPQRVRANNNKRMIITDDGVGRR
jgi:predicted phosphoribosyltransferase